MRPWSRCAVWVAVALGGGVALGLPLRARALDRKVRVQLHNLASAPVEIRDVKVDVSQVFAAPSQRSMEDDARWSRVSYANRKGQLPSKMLLTAEATLINRSPHTIEVVALTMMPMDAFNQAVDAPGRQQYAIHQIEEVLVRGASSRVRWEQPLPSADVFAVALVATAARFSDGSVWMAPREMVQEIFFSPSDR